jgi:hypothetical protein
MLEATQYSRVQEHRVWQTRHLLLTVLMSSYCQLNDATKRNPCAYRNGSASDDIHIHIYIQKLHCSGRKGSPLGPVLNQINSVYIKYSVCA